MIVVCNNSYLVYGDPNIDINPKPVLSALVPLAQYRGISYGSS